MKSTVYPASQRKVPLQTDAETFRRCGYALVDQVASLLENIAHKPVTKGEQPKEIQSFLHDKNLPLTGQPLETILDHAARFLFEHSLFNGHPRFWGYITSSAAPGGILTEMLAASVNANVGAYVLSPAATEMERQTIRWIASMIGFPQTCGGIFVSGGNMANFTALLAARKAKANWDIRQTGLGNRQMLIYCSKETHTWVNKAADLFGFGTQNIRWIETNPQQQMDVEALEQCIIADKQKGHLPFIVIATAGSVSTGAIDPLEEISLICTRHNCWFHIDGAYGTPAVIVPEVSHLFKGLELADSIALDPHKWLYSPLEAGCVLTRHPQALQDAFSFRPEYYNFDGKDDEPVINFHESGLQNSRGFRALKVWIMLQQAGVNGYRQMIGDDIKLAGALFEMVQIHPELEGISHHLSIVNFRFAPADARRQGIHYMNKLNEEIVNRVQAGGEAFVSNAVVGGRYCIRVCIVNFRTKMDDLRALTEIVLCTGKKIQEEWREKNH